MQCAIIQVLSEVDILRARKNANGKWYRFNDANIMEIKNINEIVTDKAYCLFYRKKK